MAPQWDLPEGLYRVALSSDRYAPVVLEDVLIAPDAPPIELELKPGCPVLGQEVRPEGLPPRSVIEIRESADSIPIAIVFRSPRLWRLGVLEDGKPYHLTFTEGGAVLGTRTFVARCGERVPLEVAAAPR